MEWVKTTAKTVPEAIDLALDNLGVAEDEAEIVVIEEPSKGLFGRVRGSARVEARIKPRSIRPKVDRNRNRRDGKPAERGKRSKRSRGRGSGRGGGKQHGAEARSRDGSGKAANATRADAGTDRGRPSSNGSDRRDASDARGSSRGRSGVEAPAERDEKAPVDAGGDGTGTDAGGGEDRSRKRRRRRRGKGSRGSETGGQSRPSDQSQQSNGSDRSNREPQSPTSKSSKQAGRNRPPQEETPVQEVADHLKTFLGGLTEAFGLEGDVVIDDSESDALVAMVDAQHGLMVGPKGRTLDAIQELARVSAQRSTPSSIRIKVDVGGYRRQRAEALATFARKAADKAVDNGVEVALDPMSPADRKVIHDALNQDGRVETRSVGNEPRRKVVVVPVPSGGDADEEE